MVLITADRRESSGSLPGPKVRPRRAEVWVSEPYLSVVRRTGALPLVLPPGEADVDGLLALAGGVVVTGGAFDIHPRWYGERPEGRLDRVEETRTALEIALARACLDRGVPILGICGGMQALAVASGGCLVQDLPAPDADHLEHEQPTDPASPWHQVHVDPPARRWLGALLEANSTHHQAVREVGHDLVPCGWARDGVIEVIASTSHPFALGVQWHPELIGDDRPYEALLAAIRSRC
ncbi:MAG: gamma-glutamyl-gamma-aminobutyrate hydrolase family protein [Deltaproteobacteria bacterium]|nr:gamma-glutamyl-gamma-aminobutyrate hydrolase family protein [Deltaproteobacteria bacterium]MBW2255225.1 gamma-glutamyl-gamma-aminobutyrate hydrolase family protein [Deltaproteobacteria bacterium]